MNSAKSDEVAYYYPLLASAICNERIIQIKCPWMREFDCPRWVEVHPISLQQNKHHITS